MLTFDVKNAFNSANWGNILHSVTNQSVPTYLCEMLDDYLKNRILIYTSDGLNASTPLTSGVPQEFILGLTLWNII